MQKYIKETLKNYLCNKDITITLILKKRRPSWTPSWISQNATSLCKSARQSDKLQTLPNILIYDSLC